MRKIRIQDVKAEHIIGRSFEEPDLSDLKRQIKRKTIAITGAGGSIGSELTRQLVTNNIKKIILIEHSELNLYRVMEDLNYIDHPKDVVIVPVLLNLCFLDELEMVFREHQPDFVYHAAAYKHVNLVQLNPYSGLYNNIQSTLNIMKLSSKYHVEKFVLISTDKAVRSTNIMGASKRVCELLMYAYAKKTNLSFSAVRFGNVAGSSGSLIPKLKNLVMNDRALTITDVRMTRFFMLIPEAVSLVLKSSERAAPGEISLLNMGKSIKIIDIAKKLLVLSGRDPETYPIEIVGARPGEKLYEELIIKDGMGFDDNQMFIRIPDGDEAFKSFYYNNVEYADIHKVCEDILQFCKLSSPKAIDLLWKSIGLEHNAHHNIIEVDFGEHKSKEKKAA